MSDKDKNFTGSIPDIYDEFLVPLIFESYARDMAQRVAEVSPLAVLETAAGSGVVTRALAQPAMSSPTLILQCWNARQDNSLLTYGLNGSKQMRWRFRSRMKYLMLYVVSLG
jgi:hypothetical protein